MPGPFFSPSAVPNTTNPFQVRNLGGYPFKQRNDYRISGYTRDASGAILPNITVELFETVPSSLTATLVQSLVSSDLGFFSFKVDNTKQYFMIGRNPITQSTYGSLVLADGATHLWRLQESSGLTLADDIGGDTATLSSATGITYGVAGAVYNSNGLAKTAAAQWGVLASFFSSALSGYTLEGWVNAPAATWTGASKRQNIIGDDFGSFQLWFDNTGDNFLQLIFSDQFQPTGFSTNALSFDTTYHVAVVVSGGVSNFYVNGVLQTKRGGTTGLTTINISTITGSGGGDNGVNLIDEIAYYPVPLTAAQLLAHYDARANTGSIPATLAGVTLDTLTGVDTL